MNNRRSASVGALPVEKKHFVSRNESASGAVLDVRCACQYFQCESLLPDRVNPIESRPTSKQGFLSDMEHHGDHNAHHFDNISTGSFNMMGRSTEFDRISTAGSFGGRGLVVRSISDANEPEMISGMMAGHRGRQMSIGGMSGGSYGGRDPDAVSVRSGISLRRVSRSPSHADLFVADLNIPRPTGHVSRGFRRDAPRHITNLPSSSPVSGKISSPEFSKYDRNNVPLPKVPTRPVTGENKENVSGYAEKTLPQNKPIDISRYEERHDAVRGFGQRIEIPQLNLVAPTPTPTMENTASPDFGRRNVSPKGLEQSHRSEDNRPHISGYSGTTLPQNQPIDVSMYEEEGGEPMEISNLYASMHGQSVYDRKTVHPERAQPNQMLQDNRTLHHENILPQNMSIDVPMFEENPSRVNSDPNRTQHTNVVAPPPSTSGFGQRPPPNVDIYDRKNQSTSGIQQSSSREEQGNILPQNKPIDVSMYEDNLARVNTEPNGNPKTNMGTHSLPRPGFGSRSPPNVDIYDQKSQGPSGVSYNQRQQEPQQGNILPQNKPIDVSMYEERVSGGATVSQAMDIDVEAIEAVVEVRDNIKIDRMSPPLQLNVPDLSPKVENETRIEIRNFAPQPDLRPLDEILKDGKQIGHLDQFNDPNSHSHGQSPLSPSQLSQLKRQHRQERGMSPNSSKKQLMERGLSPDRQSYQRGSSPGRQNMNSDEFRYRGPDIYDQSVQRGSSLAPIRPAQSTNFQRGSSPAPISSMEERQNMLPDRQSYQKGSPLGRPDMNSDEFRYRGPDIYDQPVQRGSSPAPIRSAQSTTFSSQIFQRESSPAPVSSMEDRKHMQYESNPTFDRGLSPARSTQTSPRGSSPAPRTHLEDKQYSQYESTQTFNRGLSPPRTDTHHTDTKQHLRRASPPASSFHTETRQLVRERSPAPQSYQRASSPVPMEIQQMEPRQLLQRGSPQGVSFKRNTEPTQSPSQRASSPAPASWTQSLPRASSPPTGTLKSGRILNFRRSFSMERPKTSDKVLERKLTYSSRFMSMFHSKNTDPSGEPLNEKRRVSADHIQDIKRGRSTSRFMSVFHSKPSPDPLSQPPLDKRKFSADVILHMDRGRSTFMDRGRSPSLGKQLKPESSPSRFMSMFHSKASDQTVKSETPPHNNLELPTNNLLRVDRGRSPSPSPSSGKQPKPEGSPSSSRFMGVFKREKVERSAAMSVVEEPSHQANMSIQKPPEKPLLTVKVTETFSLKVDEMDQYTSHPPKSPSPVRQTHLYSSSDQLGQTQDRHIAQDRFTRDGLSESIAFSVDHQEPFAPVVLSSSRSSQMHLVAGDRRNYMSASQADLSGSRRFDSHELIPPAPAQIITVGNKKLVSVPIAVPDFYDSEMTISEFMRDEHENQKNISYQPQRSNLMKAPSEQRLAQSRLLQRKSHERTQSQDRAAAERASELDRLSISTRSKTVSFNFGGHGSRLGQHEKMESSSNNQLDKKHWLERTYFSRDHEYEPIGEPSTEIKKEPTPEPPALVSALKKESSPAPVAQEIPKLEVSQPSIDAISDEALSRSEELREAEELQKDIEDRYFSSAATTTQPEPENDYDMQASQVESSALELEDMPMEAEAKKKGFMANAQDKTRRMQAGLKNQAGKIKTKFRTQKKAPSGSPKATNRKRFKAPEFSKIKMPEMKRPEFTKFSKPDMSKFKLPDKFSSLKLTRSKSFKEPTEVEDTTVSGTTPESGAATAPPKKQRFDFSFGTYPRAFKKKPKPQEVESTLDEPSVIQSTETQPSAESSSTPQGDRGPGPVRSRWADKFSDVSYNDSEGSRYRRFESEQESSFDRESSMERRMKEVLDENAKEEAELSMLGVVEQKQFADYDEENRVIHEISKTREREFKRRPMVHQDSDLVSEEGRDIGWTKREAEKNQILRKAELEAESHAKYAPKREQTPETQSTASSKRFVFEEISSDEFLLRKKGASQEFSIGKQKYLDADLDKSGNDLEAAGSQLGSLNGSSIDRIDYGYDVPPPKPRRLSQQQRQRHHYDSENASQIDDYGDDISLSQAGSDYFRHAPPSRPLRKGRFKNSQDMSVGGTPSIQYDDEDYSVHNQNFIDEEKENIHQEPIRNDSPIQPPQPPQPPRRRRKQLRDSLEKDSYINGFGGRSVSNSYLREDNKPEEVIVYRTEHEYKIPLATPENYTDTSATPRKSKSLSRLGIDEDDRTSRGADSLALDHTMRGDNDDDDNLNAEELHEKYIIEMMENDGYAVVRKDNLPKPTPPARRKKFSRSPGERFATMPHQRKASPSLMAEHKVSTGNYSTIGRPSPPRRKSALSLTADPQKDYGSQDFTDYEEPELDERPESPRNLQSGDIINKMKYRPLPPPPRPPREKRYRDRHGGDDTDEIESRDDRDDRDGGGERIAYDELHEQSSDDYNQQQNVEVEVSTQTDPLPDDFVCEEFEITEDMKIIEPRRTKTLDEILKEEEEADLERAKQIDEEILARGIQRFREASQRSASDRSRASSQAKSLSRPQTPSAILIEKRIPTPVPNSNGQTVLEASLTVQPIDDLDLEEELLRREGLYDGSHSKSDGESRHKEEEEHSARAVSEEENARVDEEVQSYTRSTDAESQLEEEERELERQQELALEAERRLHIEEEKREREREEEEEANRRLQEEVEADERLLRELEEEQRFLEEALRRHAEEEKELERRIQEEEEEEERKRILEELQLEHRLHPDSMSEEHESYDEERSERLKAEDSYEHKSEMSEEKETTPLPSPTPPPMPQQVEEEISVSQVKKLLLEQPPKEQSHEREATLSPPPMAPPRKRSTAEALSVTEQQPVPVPFTGVMPSHLTLADLEVERLRVHALQAGQIMVSHLHGAQIQAEELECRSGNLVVKNIELPPGFIEDIVERVRSTEREHAQAATQTISEARTQTEEDSIPPPPIPTRQPEIPPVRPPPPSSAHFLQLRDHEEVSRIVHPTDYHLQTIPPIGFYNHLHPDDDGELAAGPPPVYRRRRHHRRRDSSSEEEHQRRHSRSIRPEQPPPPQSVAQAGRQFISACSLPLVNVITQLTNALRPNNDNNKDQVQPRNISTAVVLLVVMALSFVIYLLTGRNIHHHHWDYFNPPGNDGRLS